MLDNSDHWAKNAIPRAVRMVPTKTAISFCLRPQIAERITIAVRKDNKCTALMIIFLLPRCKWVCFSELLINTLVMEWVIIYPMITAIDSMICIW